jgi:hypothetical protein
VAYVPTDADEFGGPGLTKLKEAVRDTCYLLNRGFENSGVVTFVGQSLSAYGTAAFGFDARLGC